MIVPGCRVIRSRFRGTVVFAPGILHPITRNTGARWGPRLHAGNWADDEHQGKREQGSLESAQVWNPAILARDSQLSVIGPDPAIGSVFTQQAGILV